MNLSTCHQDSTDNPFLPYEYKAGTARYSSANILFDKAQDTYIYDTAGQKYIDMCAGFGSLPLGHNHPQIISLIQQYSTQSRIMAGMSDVYATQAKSAFLAYLGSLLPPGFDQVALTVTGSDAVEFALKTAAIITQKPGVLVFDEGYHGLGIATTYLTGIAKFRAPLPSSWLNPHISYISHTATIDEISDTIVASHSTAHPIGQMIIEPILGRAGVRILAESWLIELKATLEQLGCLLIYDEVFVGIGRAGKLFLANRRKADLICLAKAIGGGMPLSCVAASSTIMNHWPANHGEALHTGTYFGHALSCAVAHKTLELIMEHNLSERAQTLGQQVMQQLQDSIKDHPTIKDVRGQGLMMALDLAGTKQGVRLAELLKTQHQIIAIPSGIHGECLSLSPSLLIDETLLQHTLSTIVHAAETLPPH